MTAQQHQNLYCTEPKNNMQTSSTFTIMTVLSSISGTNLHTGMHWASRQLSLDFNRGHVLGIVLTLVLFLLLLNLISSAPADALPGELPVRTGATGFRGLPVSDDLSLQDAARNHEYYRIMTSVCHRRGQDSASAAYAYLFHANSRLSQNNVWSGRMFDMAVDSVERYFDIDPVADCNPEAGNFHGLDLDADLRLQANALNYVFFSKKVGLCRQAGNEVQARSYIFEADTELDKASNGRRSRAAINAAIREARSAVEIQHIRGC